MFKWGAHPTVYELKIDYILQSNNPKKKVHTISVGYTTQRKEVDRFMDLDFKTLDKLVHKYIDKEGQPKSVIKMVEPVNVIHDNVCVTDILESLNS